MQVRKTVKKIASIGAAVGMVGATLMGAAMAADLSEYPYMFIEDGKFNGILVVGAEAKAEDIIGITNIATSLQSVSVKTSVVGDTGTADMVTVADGIELCTNDWYVEFGLADCEKSIDEAELPDLLGDATFHDAEGSYDNDERYTQEVLFQTNSTAQFKFAQDDDDAPVADTYIWIDASSTKYLYNYSLEFDDRVDFDNTSTTTAADDLEGTTIEIQANDYTITDVKVVSGSISEIEMQAGQTVVWMSEGESITRTLDGVDHTVEMIDVTADATETTGSCGFSIDGTTAWIDVGDTDTINGVTIGALDAKAVNIEAQDQDVCKVVVGAHEIKIVDNDELEINDEPVDGTLAKINEKTANLQTFGKWTGFSVAFAPDTDEVYLGPGDEYVDPIFGNFKLVFGGVYTGGVETLEWVTNSKNGHLYFTNEDGREVDIPLAADENYNAAEEAADEPVFLANDAPTSTDGKENKQLYLEGELCTGSSTLADCAGAQFLVVTTTTNEAHVIEIDSIDTNDNQINFQDITYGTTDKDMDYTNGTAQSFSLGAGVGTITLTVDETAGSINFTSIGSSHLANITTAQQGVLTVVNNDQDNQTYDGWHFDEKNDGDLADARYKYNTTVYAYFDDATDNSIEFSYSALTGDTHGYGFEDESSDNDDFQKFLTWKGTLITYDNEDKQSFVLEHPQDAVYAEVYVAPTDAVTYEVAAEGAVTEEVQKISVNAVKLDSEVTSVTDKNIVAVGGPCANSVVAELMGSPADCENALGITSGQALVKLFENGDYVAVVIAGQDAMDTRLACQIMANWETYTLTGDEMIATTVSESSLSVTAQ